MKAAIDRALTEHGHGWVSQPSGAVSGNWLIGPKDAPHAIVVVGDGAVWVCDRMRPAIAQSCRTLLLKALRSTEAA
jgi:streptogramin lyase